MQMSQILDTKFEEALKSALALTPSEQARLLRHVAAALSDKLAPSEQAWTVDEGSIKSLTTGEKILASGLIGSWADIGIEDSEAWLEEAKQKRREENQW
jgi:hypothetical protein